MSSLVYIVRSPLHELSHALLPRDDSTLVLSLEDLHLPGKVLRATPTPRLPNEERLSYEQVLAIVLESKVVTL